VVREFADQPAVAAEARARLTGIGTWAWWIKRGLADVRVAHRIPASVAPLNVVVVPKRSELFVGTGTGVAIIDARRRAVLHEIPLGEPVFSLGAATDGSKVLAGHYSGKLRVIDTATRIATTVAIQGGLVNDLCVTPDSRWAYVAALEYGLKKLNLKSKSVVTVWIGGSVVRLALSPNGRMLFAILGPPAAGGSPGRNAIAWFDGDSGHFANAITGLPLVASWLTLTPDGSQLWAGAGEVCNSSDYDHRGCPEFPSKAIHVISTAGPRLIRTLGYALPGPGWAAPFPDGSIMTLGGNQALLLVDTKTLEVIRPLPLIPTGNPAFSADDAQIYVPQGGEPAIAVLEFAPIRPAPPATPGAPPPLPAPSPRTAPRSR
jgi:hypothetical protein